MGRRAARLLAYVFSVVVALALTGCASVTVTPGSGVDPDRFVSAIETDDVHFVRSAVQSGAVSVNQRVPAPGCVPAMNASWIAPGVSAGTSVPLPLSTDRKTMLPGASNCGGSSLSGRASM